MTYISVSSSQILFQLQNTHNTVIFIIIIKKKYGASVHLIVEKNDLYNPLKCVLLCPAEEWKS